MPETKLLFEHSCRNCGKKFSPDVDLARHEVLIASCPHCGHRHGYDNRSGKLSSLVAQRVKHVQAQGESAAPPVTVEKTPEPSTTTTVAESVAAQNSTLAVPSPWTHSTTEPVAAAKKEHRFALKKPLLSLSNLRRFKWQSAVVGSAALLIFFFIVFAVMQAIPTSAHEVEQALARLKARQSDVVIDRNGHELNRLGVAADRKASLAEFHKWQIDMLLFAEDRGFYTHGGVSYRAMVRAFLNNLLRLRYAQGASTITQQLARIMLQNRHKSIWRKLQEIRLARALEEVLPKQKILELYLNHVYLGHGNYSFAAAAQFYYEKSVAELTAAEFLSLVALIPSPEKYSPLRNNRLLRTRMQALWQAMEEAKAAPATRQDFELGLASVTAQSGRFATETAFGEKSRTGLWPALHARDFLLQRRILSAEAQNSARIYTTIDATLQQRAEDLVVRHLRAARKSFRGVIRSADAKERRLLQKLRSAAHDYGLLLDLAGLPVRSEALDELQAALIALSPRTGEILAMVGGDSFESKNQLNRTVKMRRQTGSAIKPFIYAKALSSHLIHPATLIDDTPYVVGSGKKIWAPENINGSFEGPIPVREALAKSRNIPAIRVGRMLGRDGVTELFHEFFFQNEHVLESRFNYDETVAIGTISLSPLELVRAFSVFANEGFLPDPLLITRVETPDRVFDVRKTHPEQMGLTLSGNERVLSAAETQLMVSLLKSSGASAGTAVKGIIGKTGTSSESRDLWFVGGGREIVVAVWFGYDDMRIAIPGATGSALAAKLAGDFLRPDFAPVQFKMQPGMVRLRVCPLTGRLASEKCRHARSEVFISGVIPEGECLHGENEEQAEFMAVMGESQFR